MHEGPDSPPKGTSRISHKGPDSPPKGTSRISHKWPDSPPKGSLGIAHAAHHRAASNRRISVEKQPLRFALPFRYFFSAEQVHVSEADFEAAFAFCHYALQAEQPPRGMETRILADGRLQLSAQDQLQLYALHQCATIGPCNVERPRLTAGPELRKWLAWSELSNLPRKEAKNTFVEMVQAVPEFVQPQVSNPWMTTKFAAKLHEKQIMKKEAAIQATKPPGIFDIRSLVCSPLMGICGFNRKL